MIPQSASLGSPGASPVPQRRLRIAHVTATFPPYLGGTGNVCYHNALELARRGHEVHVFTAARPLAGHQDPPEFTVHRLRPLVSLGNAPLLPGLLRLDRFDIIHLHYPFIFGAELIWASAKAQGIPYVITHHNDLIGDGLRRYLFDSYSALVTRLVFGGAHKFAVVSRDHAAACRLTPLLRRRWDDVAEVPNGVDTDRFRPGLDGTAVRQQYGIPEGAKVILFVGALDRAHHFKGVPYLLRALERLRRTDAVLLLAGDGDLRPALAQLAGDLGVADRVCFAGGVPHDRLPLYYAAAEVTVLPSFPPESFGLVLIEAMACGRPVVAHNIPGVRSVVSDGTDGLLAQPGDVDDLAATIETILGNPALGAQMGAAGRHKVEARYDWRHIGAALERVYLEALGAERRSTASAIVAARDTTLPAAQQPERENAP